MIESILGTFLYFALFEMVKDICYANGKIPFEIECYAEMAGAAFVLWILPMFIIISAGVQIRGVLWK